MKTRILLIPAIILLSQALYGQNLDDALRYSQSFYQGTARFTGMGGAFTALGGDLSAIPLNPASGSLIRSFELAVTPQLTYNNIDATFTGRASDFVTSTALAQIGFVTSAQLGSGAGLRSVSFAYSYNKTNDFNARALIEGTSESSSIADYWASKANGYSTGELAGNTADGFMAYDTWLIDTLSGSYDQYASVFSAYGESDYVYGQATKRVIDNKGYSAEHTLAFSANIGDKLYLGASIGITSFSYTGHYQHSETDEAGTIFDFVNLTYIDHFEADGDGLNVKIGAILRPIEALKLGLSFSSPTVYNVNEYYYANLTAHYDGDLGGTGTTYEANRDGAYYSYKLKTPARINTGIALQLGTSAILSADYEFIDYSNATMSKGADGYEFNAENEDIKAELKNAQNLRLGAEYRLGALYMRGGYRHYGSAFRKGSLNEDRDYSGYSVGLGYRQKSFYLDFAYSALMTSEQYMMYPDSYLDPVTMESDRKTFTATLGLKF